MDKERIKLFGLIGIIVLAGILFTIAMAITIKKERETSLFSEQAKIRKKTYLQPETSLPQIEDIEEETFLAQESSEESIPEEKLEEVELRNLPLEKLSREKKSLEGEILTKESKSQAKEKQKPDVLETIPSSEEIGKLKRKGLIIF